MIFRFLRLQHSFFFSKIMPNSVPFLDPSADCAGVSNQFNNKTSVLFPWHLKTVFVNNKKPHEQVGFVARRPFVAPHPSVKRPVWKRSTLNPAHLVVSSSYGSSLNSFSHFRLCNWWRSERNVVSFHASWGSAMTFRGYASLWTGRGRHRKMYVFSS